MLPTNSNATLFYGTWVDAVDFDFDKYLKDWAANLKKSNNDSSKMLYYDAKEIPLLHQYQFSHLSTFNFFLDANHFILQRIFKMQFEDIGATDKLHKTGLRIIEIYNRISSAEIRTFKTINSTSLRI